MIVSNQVNRVEVEIKNPQLNEGGFIFKSGEYKIWTCAPELMDDGLAILCNSRVFRGGFWNFFKCGAN